MMSYDPTNPRDVKEQRARLKLAELNEGEDLKKILSMPEGRRVLWRYLSFCGIHHAEFLQSGSALYYREGGRNVGIKIQSDIMQADPEAFFLMMREQQGESK